ncbi:Bug family tripartite tricarboxylate transporter substrate binding protein [Alloalcanivorax sp. C16-2]|uniref:Bug family tripartite tricarboxylate transporter substrate binding protein n=1 Tax=Alloalcanivorax sp. C16-2 TaxID=3390052 RepID=UPI0039710D67
MKTRLLHALMASFFILWVPFARAGFPDQEVRIVVPYPPGGANDILARTLGQELSERWGVPVVVDNRSGAAGMIATEYVAQAQPDGHTLLLPNIALIQAPHLYQNVKVDPMEALRPVAGIATTSLLMVVRSDLDVHDAGEFVEHVRAHPDDAFYGTYGAGSSAHLYGHVFSEQNDLDLIHVAFRGEAPSVNELLAGQIPMVFMSGKGALPLIEDGQVRALGVTGEKRLPQLPEVRTFQEQGFERMNYQGWFGVFGPSGMPEPVVAEISDALMAAVAEPSVVERMGKLSLIMEGTPHDQFVDRVERDSQVWGGIIDDAGLTLD